MWMWLPLPVRGYAQRESDPDILLSSLIHDHVLERCYSINLYSMMGWYVPSAVTYSQIGMDNINS